MKKNLFLGLLLCSMFMFSSCEDEGLTGSTGKGLVGYYTKFDWVAQTSDFDEINEAINNHELLADYGKYGKYYATYDLFIDEDGCFSTSDNHCGRLRFSVDNFINVIRILDSNTLLFYSASLYVDGMGEGDELYKLYAGPIFGNLTYKDTPSYYTYTVIDNNKIVVSNGDIYTIVDGGLIKDGSSSIWSKYDPTKLH